MRAGATPWAIAELAPDNRPACHHGDARRIAKDRPLARLRVRGEENHGSDGKEQRERPRTAHAFVPHAGLATAKTTGSTPIDLPSSSIVMPALVAGIHVLNSTRTKDLDGRKEAGHDE